MRIIRNDDSAFVAMMEQRNSQDGNVKYRLTQKAGCLPTVTATSVQDRDGARLLLNTIDGAYICSLEA